jgi:uncharacterized repeat protein (TIGR01451 family)
LNTIPIPLAAFTGVDLSDIRSISFDFDQQPEGGLLLTDIAFSNVGIVPQPGADGADLSLDMADAPDPVRVGKELKYTIRIANTGPERATHVVLVDTLPLEVSFKEASDDCSYANHSITCPPIELAVGQSEEYEFKVIVETRPSDGSLENTASVSADQVDPDTSNNSATEITRISGSGASSNQGD